MSPETLLTEITEGLAPSWGNLFHRLREEMRAPEDGRLVWEGTATQLYALLQQHLPALEAETLPPDFPGNARALGAILRELAPALRRQGVHLEFFRQGKKSTRTIRLTYPEADANPRQADANSPGKG